MIQFLNLNKTEPYKKFHKLYELAEKTGQLNPDAACISSFDEDNDCVDSRYVNIKYINQEEWIFFSNYNSPKSKQIRSNEKISVLFFWPAINSQIRIKAKAFFTDQDFSNKHFQKRDQGKNLLAAISYQSQPMTSYKEFLKKYEDYEKKDIVTERPTYWGGISFVPFYFEFWTGKKYRLNERISYEKNSNGWNKILLQP